MALQECHECDKKVSSEAQSCPHCGAPVLKNPPKKSILNKKPGCLLTSVFIILLMAFIGSLGDKAKQSGTTKSEPDQITVMTMTQMLVEKQLKAPRTAKHPTLKDYSIENLGGGKFKVSSFVDSQNSFGALIRTHYTTVIKNVGGEGDKWIIENFNTQK